VVMTEPAATTEPVVMTEPAVPAASSSRNDSLRRR
jgi:hypothetical protein